MSDLIFEIQAKWSGSGEEGEGELTIGEQTFCYSAPANMGGKGVGVSPEDLLISAVTTCYSGTFYRMLEKFRLPAEHVKIRAEGFVAFGPPTPAKFKRILVHPTVIGGDETRSEDYAKAATTARDHCFIGKSIAGNIDYEVGEVQIVREVE